MTPIIHIRSYSTDQYYLDKIFYSNFYRLKKLNSEASVLDVGAHCGYFVLTAIAAGYNKICAFEPYVENYRMLLKNTEIFSDTVKTFQLGIYHSEDYVFFESPQINQSQFLDYGILKLDNAQKNNASKTISLSQASKLVDGYIDLLKINIGYEYDFVTNNEEAFSKINNICLEMTYSPEEMKYIKGKLTELGFSDSLILELKEKERNFGFLAFFSKNKLDDVFNIEDLRDKNYET